MMGSHPQLRVATLILPLEYLIRFPTSFNLKYA